MVSQFITTTLFCLAGWLFWKVVRRLMIPSPLDDIPGPESESFVTGLMGKLYGDDVWDFYRAAMEKYGGVIKFKGFLGSTHLHISDPKALHSIVIKEQHIYEETPNFLEVNKLTFGPGLLSSLGEQHRKQRKMLNPVFSIAHMREMVPIFYNVTRNFRDSIAKKVQSQPQEIEIFSWLARTALELIGQSGFGYSFDVLGEDSIPHPYGVSARRYVTVAGKLIIMHFCPAGLLTLGPAWFRRFLVEHAPFKAVQEMKEIVDIMHKTSVEILESKRKALEEGDEETERQIAKGKDILSILLRENMRADKEDKLEEDELIAQMSTLTFAAMDTTSSALARILYLLAQHQPVQDRLRNEIRQARALKDEEQGEFGYDDLERLVYLDAVCRETMRLYPPVTTLFRTTREATVLPLSSPMRTLSNKTVTQLPIPKDTRISISIIGCNQNPKIWGDDAYEWKPERWLQPLRDEVVQAKVPGVYSNLMTFLGGGRACIGFKFAQLEMKVVLSLLIDSFKFTPSDKQIIWRKRGITSPCVVGDDPSNLRLPLIVQKAD